MRKPAGGAASAAGPPLQGATPLFEAQTHARITCMCCVMQADSQRQQQQSPRLVCPCRPLHGDRSDYFMQGRQDLLRTFYAVMLRHAVFQITNAGGDVIVTVTLLASRGHGAGPASPAKQIEGLMCCAPWALHS